MQASFTIPTPQSVVIFTVIIAIILIAVLILLVLPVCLLKIEVSSEEVVVKAPPMYSFSAKRGDVEEVYVADLNSRSDLKPSLRTWGHGLPGYSLGWFKLKNGAKAFLAVSSNVAVVFKLRGGEYLLVTPTNIDGFITTLQGLGWSIVTR
ncbi:MAG: hypothetical protein HA494_07345 [Thaumarchaeota archaeon]|jgi:hypothetical protein|nr:hypothetical protein [Nitrososphaerota archaeon]